MLLYFPNNLKCPEGKCILCFSKEKSTCHFMGLYLSCGASCWQVNHVIRKHRRDTFLRVTILCFHKGFCFGYHTQRNNTQMLGHIDVHINNPPSWNSLEFATWNISEKLYIGMTKCPMSIFLSLKSRASGYINLPALDWNMKIRQYAAVSIVNVYPLGRYF
jgi:hypothetical protein